MTKATEFTTKERRQRRLTKKAHGDVAGLGTVVPRYARSGGQEHREDKPVRILVRFVFAMLLPTTPPAGGRRTTGLSSSSYVFVYFVPSL